MCAYHQFLHITLKLHSTDKQCTAYPLILQVFCPVCTVSNSGQNNAYDILVISIPVTHRMIIKTLRGLFDDLYNIRPLDKKFVIIKLFSYFTTKLCCGYSKEPSQ